MSRCAVAHAERSRRQGECDGREQAQPFRYVEAVAWASVEKAAAPHPLDERDGGKHSGFAHAPAERHDRPWPTRHHSSGHTGRTP